MIYKHDDVVVYLGNQHFGKNIAIKRRRKGLVYLKIGDTTKPPPFFFLVTKLDGTSTENHDL